MTTETPLTIVSTQTIKTGVSRYGREWTLSSVQALDQDGQPVSDLVSFEDLMEGPGSFEVTRSERHYGRKTYVSFQVSVPKGELPAAAGPETVPAGRYALGDANQPRFYKVWRGSRNPNFFRIYKLDGGGHENGEIAHYLALGVLAEIAVDARSAALLYGRLLVECSICGISLKTRLSRELGIGPVCGARFYEPTEWRKVKRLAKAVIESRGFDPAENIGELAAA